MAATFVNLASNPKLHLPSRRNPNRPFSSYKPITATLSTPIKQSYWASINADLEAHLERSIPRNPSDTVYDPMHHLIFAAPRTMAPALCVASCELVGGDRDHAAAAASALHLMHAATYTHDHLPYLLDPDRARVQHKYGANVELLTGDAISPLGFELIARSDSDGNNSERVLRVIIEIGRAMSAQGMAYGQLMHVRRTGSPGNSANWVEQVCEKKDGGLYACGAACGAILGGASEEEIEKLRRFGHYVGMIYGILYGVGREEMSELEKGFEMAREFRSLALLELEGFEQEKVGEITSLIDVCM